MISLRKKLISNRISKFLDSSLNSEMHFLKKDFFSFILIFQINNINAKYWRAFKSKLSKVENAKAFMIKNKLALQLLNKSSKKITMKEENNLKENSLSWKKPSQSFHSKIGLLFQGPTCIITCHSLSELVSLNALLKNYSNFNFIGGFYKDMLYTHLDLKVLIQLDNRNLLKLSNEVFPLFLNNFAFLFIHKAKELLDLLGKNKKDLVNITYLMKQVSTPLSS